MKDLSRLTIDEKVGQLFFLGFTGYEPDAEVRSRLDTIRPGGFILSQRNIDSFDQLNRLTREFVEGRDVPAFVGIHQEGGPNDRLKQLFAPLPALSEVATGGATQVRFFARVLASELEALGIDTLFGPVLDLATPGSILQSRTLASTSGEVTRLGTAFVEEFRERGILTCAKHFPGLGGAQRDPHFAIPRIDKPKKALLQEDILPFLNLIDDVPMMMVGHGHYPSLAEERPAPACLSTRIVDGLLRRKLGFTGLIVTDDMTMGAVTSMGLTPDLFLEAFEAGNDLLLFSQTTPLVEQAFRALVVAVKKSAALRSRLDESVGRILALKQQRRLPSPHRPQIRARVIRQIDRITQSLQRQTRLANAARP
jgi:beta-N-acetylhexosaminidase